MAFDYDLAEYTPAEKQTLYVHTFFALLCCPLYWLGPTLIGYVFTPYILWMIFKGRSVYFLPLVIHTFYGSQQRTIMLFGCFVFCLLHFDALIRKRLNWLFLLYLCISPFFIWFTYQRYMLRGFGGMFEGMGTYLTFAAFFWGTIVGPTIRRGMVKALYWVSILMFVDFILAICPSSTFFYHWLASFLIVYAFWNYECGRLRENPLLLATSIVSCLLLALGFLKIVGAHSMTFNMVGVTMVGCGTLFVWRHARWLTFLFHPIVLLAATMFFLFNNINGWEERKNDLDFSVAYNEIEVKDWKGIMERWKRKSVGDRGVLWKATWNTIRRQMAVSLVYADPVYFNPGEVEFERDGVVHSQTVVLQAHNVFLELLRNYNLYGGGGMYLMYVLVACLCWPKWIFRNYYGTHLAPVTACCLGHIIVGGEGGQYPVVPLFSFVIFAPWGMAYSAKNPSALKLEVVRR